MEKGPKNAQAHRKEAEKINKLVVRAEQGDEEALPEVKKYFKLKPDLWDIWGDLAIQAERALVAVAAGENLMLREGIYKKLGELKKDLAGPSPSPLERLLAERITACWLQVQYADAMYAQRMGDLTKEQADHFQCRQDRAHRRYLSAIRILAQVRRLLVPAVQVNIGAQQMNTMQASSSGKPD